MARRGTVLILLTAAAAAVALSGDVSASSVRAPTDEVVVTLKAPALSAFGRRLQAASHATYLRQMEAAQSALVARVRSTIPGAQVRWRYHVVANGFAVVVPRAAVGDLARVPGVAQVWPNVRYHALRANDGVSRIGADQLWGADLSSAGNGMKIGIIDDGLEATHPYFDPAGFAYPPGFPKGQTKYATPKVIVQRTFAPPKPTWKYANVPFDPTQSFHATHVAGIAAGDHGANANGSAISGVAPKAYLGNYKALTIPTPGFGLDGNSAEIAAAIESAVSDGMNVINLSLGEPEVAPSRDLVVHAIDQAAAAGVVPVVAAGNDFDDFGYGSVSSPGNAPDAITVAAADIPGRLASFSSAGPTPISLELKPDVTAPGVDILSSLPNSQGGPWGPLQGTSMAAPHVAGAAALLLERHPTWTVQQVKSALVLTGDPVRIASGGEAVPLREGGGMIDLPRADNPLLFDAPTGLTFGRLAPRATRTASTTLTDAGGGAGTWTVTSVVQAGAGAVSAPPTVTVPGALTVTAQAGATPGDVSGFVVLSNGSQSRRIPYWFAVSAPQLPAEKALALSPGVHRATTRGAPSRVSAYAYPTGGDKQYPGPERAFRVRITGRPANFGVAVLSGDAVPHVVIGNEEDHLAGYTGLPLDLNPYRAQYGAARQIAGAVLPTPGEYEIVFDTVSASAAGPFTFRYWVDDTTPPTLRLRSAKRGIAVTATDTGAGVDPRSIVAKLDGKKVTARFASGVIRVAAAKGRHVLKLSVADNQETKNMEDVAKILPNTRTATFTVRVR